MLKIKRLGDAYSVVVNDKESSSFTVDELFRVMYSLNVDPNEVEYAIMDMVDKGNQIAYFGIHRMFMFSK